MKKIPTRLITVDDLELLQLVDKAYCDRFGQEPMVNLRSLNFYSRSGHSFASLDAGRYSGFVFAHAIWNGTKAVVQVSRIATLDDEAVAKALIEAVLKSAYDAAVYDLQVIQPKTDTSGLEAFVDKDFVVSQTTLLTRKLGSKQFGD